MLEFKSPTGADIVINPAPWKDAKALKNAIEKEAQQSGASLDFDKAVEGLIPTILQIDSSPVLDAALWPCLIRCTRNGEKITESTFDDVAARRDYYEVVIACIKENLTPLFESLFSVFAKFGQKTKQAENAQESK